MDLISLFFSQGTKAGGGGGAGGAGADGAILYNVEREGEKGRRERGKEIRRVDMEGEANFGVEETAVYLLCNEFHCKTHTVRMAVINKDFPIIVVT